MIKFCLKKWEQNKGLLEKELRTRTDLNSCGYKTLVEMVVTYIFNDGVEGDGYDFSGKRLYRSDRITEIDDGDYQGTLLYLIPHACYQPTECNYLMTNVGYGSCSGCDTLQGIQHYKDGPLTDEQVSDFMKLCRDIVSYTIRPYNCGWRHLDEFDPVEEG